VADRGKIDGAVACSGQSTVVVGGSYRTGGKNGRTREGKKRMRRTAMGFDQRRCLALVAWKSMSTNRDLTSFSFEQAE
jgi:hypothetical protein